MDASVVVGVIGIVVSIGVYYLGRHHGRRQREEERRQNRIDGFVNDYVDRARRNIVTGITALVPAGVFRLRNDSEIREALETCGNQLGKHPLGSEAAALDGVDLKTFFDFVAIQRIDFAATSVAQALSMLHVANPRLTAAAVRSDTHN